MGIVQELVVTSKQQDRALQLASAYGGTLYSDDRTDTAGVPFAALLRLPASVSLAAELSADPANLGLYRVICRTVKSGTPDWVALFPMRKNPELSHADADRHWAEQHAPLALIHHQAMTQYIQLAVEETLSGEPFDGFALCGFASLDHLKHKFFSHPEGPQVIAEDVQRFADTRRSPRRLITRRRSFSA